MSTMYFSGNTDQCAEFVMCTYENSHYVDGHGKALPMLLQHRGSQQLQTPRSRKLFFSVQNQIVGALPLIQYLCLSDFIKFQINACTHNSDSAGRVLGDLSAIYDEPDNPGARLRNVFKDVSDIQVLIAAIKDGGENDDLSRESVSIALERARSVDKALVDWGTFLRPSWQYNVHDGRDVCRSSQHYWKYVHIYGNLWICRV